MALFSEIFEIASLEIAKKTNLKPKHIEPRKGYTKHSFADITRARKKLKHSSRFSFEDGSADPSSNEQKRQGFLIL